MTRPHITYRELDMVRVPEDIPELGIQSGYLGTADCTYPVGGEAGRGLYEEISRPNGITIGFAQLEANEEGAWRVMTYTPCGQ